MHTTWAVAFIICVAGLVGYAVQKPTVLSGAVVGADLVEHNRERGWKKLQCPGEATVGHDGASLACKLELADGGVAFLHVRLDRDGMYRLDVGSESHPQHHHVPKSSDPWGD